MTIAAQLDAAMKAAGLNVVSISLGKEDDPSTWKVQLAAKSAQSDYDTAAAVITAFRPVVEVEPPTLDTVVKALLAKGILSQTDLNQ